MNSIRFTNRDAFVEALESRRKFWREHDKRNEREHKAAEQKWLAASKAKMREAPKWDYATFKKEYGYLSFRDMPRCPALMEPKIDRVLAALALTQSKSFVVDTRGVWSVAHDLLTADPDARTTVC